MSADGKFSESLARLEHKVDVLMALVSKLVAENPTNLKYLQDVLTYEQVGSQAHKCFLCAQNVEYVSDPIDAVVVRKCGCKTGKIALDMRAFVPPALPAPRKENDSGEQQQEDRRNPASRSGARKG